MLTEDSTALRPLIAHTPVAVDSDLQREVYGVLGLPLDALDLSSSVELIHIAAERQRPFWISTVNVNFLNACSANSDFRRSVMQSDLSTADGMPVVWLARLLGVPLPERLAGSDIFEALRRGRSPSRLSVFVFGGPEGVAARLEEQLNKENGGLVCAGSFYPGFGDLDTMSTDAVLGRINDSNATFLVVALGASKGQLWLLRNRERINAPIRAHLGAAINFEAGTIRRAPAFWREVGLEWLWRIKEEPHLYKRYVRDAWGLARTILFQVLPLLVLSTIDRLQSDSWGLKIDARESPDQTELALAGAATAAFVPLATEYFRAAINCHKNVTINLAETCRLDARFLGLILMLNKILVEQGLALCVTSIPEPIARRLKLSGFGFLLQ